MISSGNTQVGIVANSFQLLSSTRIRPRHPKSIHVFLALFRSAFLRALAIVGLLAAGSTAVSAERPNILFVLTDDVGWGDTRVYNPNGRVALPAIERLASEGIRFTDAHTSAALCAPSRYSIYTGNYQWRGRNSWGVWTYKGGSQILAGQDSLGNVLRRAGYATAVVGKYHLGAHMYRLNSAQFVNSGDPDSYVDFGRPMSDGAAQHGFDYSFLAVTGIQDPAYAFFENGALYGNPMDMITWAVGDYGDTRILAPGIGLSNWNTRNVGPTLLSKALDFIDSHQQAQASATQPKPFFLILSTEGVHSPEKPPISIGNRNVLGKSGLSARGDMLVEIDVMVERLLLSLEQHGVLQDTLIIFSSDNGAYRSVGEESKGHFANGPFRGDKGTIYEGGHRVPLIIKWGSQGFGSSPHPPGTAIGALVGIQDLFATLAELTGVPLAIDQGRDSFSFLPLLQGRATAVRDQMVHEASLVEDNAPDGGITGRHFAYRSGSWKLVFDSSRTPVGLYNLAADPYEKTNVIAQAQHAERVAAMKLALENARTSERTAPYNGTSPGTVSVPSVVGLTQSAASASITNAGLVVGTVTQQSSATVPAGSVISQNPTAGTSVAGGSAVNLVVSSGSASASASVAPTSLSFGSRQLNTTSVGQTVTIKNTGTVVLPISSITLTGTNPGQFTRSTNCPSQLPVGGTCTATVVFKPTSTGTKSAKLTVALGAGATNKTVALSGTGVNYAFSVSPTSLAFGNVTQGITSATKTVTVTNTGTVVLPIISITLSGSNPGQFSQSNGCPAQMSVGGKCTISVKFKPTSTGSKSAILKVTPGGGASAKTVALSGTGT